MDNGIGHWAWRVFGHWTLEDSSTAGQPIGYKTDKKAPFKKHRATFAFGNVLCAVIFKKLKIGLIFPIAMGTW